MAEKKLTGEVYYPTREIEEYAHAKCESLYKSAEKDPIGILGSRSKKSSLVYEVG